MALKVKSSETDESFDDEDSKMKSHITRQFKKFMKNTNGKGFNMDRRQSSSFKFKGQDKGKKDAKEGGQYNVPAGPKCFGCQGFGHMKHECPTYLKSIGKSKALAVTLSNTEPEEDSDSEDDRILNAFIATVDPTDGIVEDVEEELVESKFEKMDEQDDIHTAYEKLYKLSEKHEKLYKLTTKKFSDVELDCEELSTKFDEANQTIGALRFENNFLAEKTKKLEVELVQVRAQLERTSSVKLDDMLSIQKSASDRIGLGYGLSSSNTASSSTIVFVPSANNVKIENNEIKTELAGENLDKGKSILGASPKLEKKDVKNHRAKKTNSQKPKQKKQHLCDQMYIWCKSLTLITLFHILLCFFLHIWPPVALSDGSVTKICLLCGFHKFPHAALQGVTLSLWGEHRVDMAQKKNACTVFGPWIARNQVFFSLSFLPLICLPARCLLSDTILWNPSNWVLP